MVSDSDINAIGQALGRQFAVERVVLFGSYARHEATDDSDVDLLVVIPHEASEPDRLYVQMRKAIARRWPIPLDLIIRSSDAVGQWESVPYSVVHEALKEGRTLYDRQSR